MLGVLKQLFRAVALVLAIAGLLAIVWGLLAVVSTIFQLQDDDSPIHTLLFGFMALALGLCVLGIGTILLKITRGAQSKTGVP